MTHITYTTNKLLNKSRSEHSKDVEHMMHTVK